jgi:Tfp pilus assembly protein PilP
VVKPTDQKTLCSRVPARTTTATAEPAKEHAGVPIEEGRSSIPGQWIVLGILLGAWAGIGVWVWTQSPEPQRVPLSYVSGQKAKHETRTKSGSDFKIHLELLAASLQRSEKSLGSPKNIFAPVFPAQSSLAPSAPPTIATVAPVIYQPTPEELAQQAGRQMLAQFRYLGYLSRAGKDTAFLSKGNELHITQAGETIDQRVIVKTITPVGVTLQETFSNVEQVVSLAGEAPSTTSGPPNTFTPEPPVTHGGPPQPGQPITASPPRIEIPMPPGVFPNPGS